MKPLILFLFILCGNCFKFDASNTSDKYYPYLADITDDYFFYYYHFPNDIEELIVFTEYCFEVDSNFYSLHEKFFVKEITLPKLKKNASQILIENDSEEYIIRLQKDTLLYYKENMRPFSPCDIAFFREDGDIKEYSVFLEKYGNGRFFDKENNAVISKELSSSFLRGIYKLQKTFLTHPRFLSFKDKNTNEQTPIYFFLEYVLGTSPKNFCNNDEPIPTLIYFKEVEKYLEIFCKENGLRRIIWASPFYYSQSYQS